VIAVSCAITGGQALPDERLPPARDLAAVARMNRNTILRALRLLRHEGLLEFRRGHSTTMAGTRRAASCSPRPGNWCG
jgi:GntR family transcriptional regulator